MHTDHDHLQEKQTYLDSQACSLCVVLFWYCRPWLLILLLQAFTCSFLLFGFWMFKSYNCFSSVQHFFFFLLLGYLTCLLLVVTDGASSSSLIPNHLSFSSPSSSERANTRTISQQLLILSELEFRKTFLILSYIGRSVLQVYSGFFCGHNEPIYNWVVKIVLIFSAGTSWRMLCLFLMPIIFYHWNIYQWWCLSQKFGVAMAGFIVMEQIEARWI